MATHNTLTLNGQFAREYQQSATTSFGALCTAVAIIGSDGDWTRDKAKALTIEAAAAVMNCTTDEAGSRLYQGDLVAKRADGGARKLLSFATRICEPQQPMWSTVRSAALNADPTAVRRSLEALGLSTNWSVERALAKPRSKSDTDPVKAILATLVKLDAAGERAESERIVNTLMDYLSGETISFSKTDHIRRVDAGTQDNIVRPASEAAA